MLVGPHGNEQAGTSEWREKGGIREWIELSLNHVGEDEDGDDGDVYKRSRLTLSPSVRG